jgi:hypothetical protein
MLTDPAHDGRERISIVAALGEVQGPVGSAVLRHAFADAVAGLATARPSQRSELRDLACAAVYALRKRDGAAATDVFVTAAFHASQAVSNYGVHALLAVGDDRGWDYVMSRLGEILQKKASAGTRRGDQALAFIKYLAVHAEPGTDKANKLITLVRDRWRNIGDHAWIEERWPGTYCWAGRAWNESPSCPAATELGSTLKISEPDVIKEGSPCLRRKSQTWTNNR